MKDVERCLKDKRDVKRCGRWWKTCVDENKHEATIFIIVGTMHSNSDLFWVSHYWCIDMCRMTGDSHCFTEEEDDIVSINGIFTSIQYNGEIDQVSVVSIYFSQLFKSLVLTTRILTRRILTSVQNYYNIKNKHWSIQAKPTQFLIFPIISL
jgi:hypothetical protein